ncbi:hypothetical protein AO242_16160 [Pseudomonas sp. ICMP 561]|nr:hypothetical protein AO242_16160 [Pseudomonas sp. ICMP 561]
MRTLVVGASKGLGRALIDGLGEHGDTALRADSALARFYTLWAVCCRSHQSDWPKERVAFSAITSGRDKEGVESRTREQLITRKML